MNSIKGKKYLVTGASSGIGREICLLLSELGARVVLVARDENRLKESISLMNNPSLHSYFCYDLLDIAGIGALIDSAVSVDGFKFDGFIHSAGLHGLSPAKVLSYEMLSDVFRVNSFSYLEIAKHICKKQNSNNAASIVYISSIMTKSPTKAQVAYIASKAAIDGVQKALSLEYARRGIRFNSVLPGGVNTKMVDETSAIRTLSTKGDLNRIDKKTQKTLQIREVANMAVFLLDDNSSFIVGENYAIDAGAGGGMTTKTM